MFQQWFNTTWFSPPGDSLVYSNYTNPPISVNINNVLISYCSYIDQDHPADYFYTNRTYSFSIGENYGAYAIRMHTHGDRTDLGMVAKLILLAY